KEIRDQILKGERNVYRAEKKIKVGKQERRRGWRLVLGRVGICRGILYFGSKIGGERW
ncbi:11595_t:CDS:2, partial [Gigaspora rosea]